MTGVLLRHAVLNTRWWPTLLDYQRPQLIHGAMLAFIGGLIWWFFRLDSGRLFCGAGILALCVLYALSLVREKRSLSRGLAAVILRTIYSANLCVGFLFYYPKAAFDFQNSPEYREQVAEANKGFAPGGTARSGQSEQMRKSEKG